MSHKKWIVMFLNSALYLEVVKKIDCHLFQFSNFIPILRGKKNYVIHVELYVTSPSFPVLKRFLFDLPFLPDIKKLSACRVQDTPYQDIAAIVEFMYRGEINVSQV
jgi:hypothetical protein